VTTAAFRERVATLAEELGRSDSVEEVSSYLDPRGEILVSQDAHATILPLVLAGEEEESIDDVLEIVQRADGVEGFAVDITGEFTVGRASKGSPRKTFSRVSFSSAYRRR
jgi:hypothetical protein